MSTYDPNPATAQEPAPAGPPEADDPGAPPEAAGLPEYADDETPANRRFDDPQRQPVPADHPVELDEYGLTAAEARHGEPLDARLARENPDVEPAAPPGPTPYEATVRRDTDRRDPGDPDTDVPNDLF